MNDKELRRLVDELNDNKQLPPEKWEALISDYTPDTADYAARIAREIAVSRFGKKIFFRGIIEFTNYCKNDCLYCGIRRSNAAVSRYRLSREDILACAKEGYALGYRTFVLQGGEDGYFTDERLCESVADIRSAFPECAVTLSVGERSHESYKRLFDAGATRYLLRHETADETHYARLHPTELSWQRRIDCLYDLKAIGYQTGAGMMVGSPFQTPALLAKDMAFLQSFKPQMIGTGPFLPHTATPFAAFPAGSVELTLFLISLCRIMLPRVLLPATTALGTASADGRARGILAGANVIMPNLSPLSVRKKYMLYDGKAGVGDDAAAGLEKVRAAVAATGYELAVARGDYTEETK